MTADEPLAYRRSRFRTRLPRDRFYTQAHFWLRPESEARVRVGFTRFATRMLGDIVEFEFEVEEGAAIERGQVVGWIEGFKAVAELYSPMDGRFAGGNPDLDQDVEPVHRDPYEKGWLYRVEGDLPDDRLDVEGYAAFLDETIDRMMGREA